MVQGQKPTQTARVASVTQTKKGMVQCSIQLPHAGGVKNNVPVGKPHSGVMWKPETGDTVTVEYNEEGRAYIANVLSVPAEEFTAPDLAEGSMRIRFDDSTTVTVDKDDSGNYDIDIEASGEVTVDADTVKLGGESGTKPVARKGDTVSVSTTTGEGSITDGASNTEAK